ncbi:MAG: hypothetical protein IJ305_06800 [Oscillospiraceae bacterium]|nr:hypothetical protein [Oscillospiraceae bacterium]
MSKIDELKNKIIQNGMTNEDFEEFKLLLRRTHNDFLRNQHCYTTAVSLPKENSDQAIKLIQYGLETFVNDGWLGKYRAYSNLAEIYYKTEHYNEAYQALQKAIDFSNDSNEDYRIECAIDLLWMKIHIDNFEYSNELEDYYNLYQKASEFSKAFINNQFKITLAEIIIMLHYEKYECAKQAYNKLLKMINSIPIISKSNIVKKHNISVRLEITPAVSEYLKQLKIFFK